MRVDAATGGERPVLPFGLSVAVLWRQSGIIESSGPGTCATGSAPANPGIKIRKSALGDFALRSKSRAALRAVKHGRGTEGTAEGCTVSAPFLILIRRAGLGGAAKGDATGGLAPLAKRVVCAQHTACPSGFQGGQAVAVVPPRPTCYGLKGGFRGREFHWN